MKISRDLNWFKPVDDAEPVSVNINKAKVTPTSSGVKAHFKSVTTKEKIGNCLIKYDNFIDFVVAMSKAHIKLDVLDYFPVSDYFSIDLYIISKK